MKRTVNRKIKKHLSGPDRPANPIEALLLNLKTGNGYAPNAARYLHAFLREPRLASLRDLGFLSFDPAVASEAGFSFSAALRRGLSPSPGVRLHLFFVPIRFVAVSGAIKPRLALELKMSGMPPDNDFSGIWLLPKWTGTPEAYTLLASIASFLAEDLQVFNLHDPESEVDVEKIRSRWLEVMEALQIRQIGTPEAATE